MHDIELELAALEGRRRALEQALAALDDSTAERRAWREADPRWREHEDKRETDR